MKVSRVLLTRILLAWCLAATCLGMLYDAWQGMSLRHPYMLAMGLLLVAGVWAWRRLGRSLLWAVNGYGWVALVSTALMVHFEATTHPWQGWSGMASMPLIGLGVVGYLSDDARSTLAYMLGALGMVVFAGISFGDRGCAFVMLLGTAMMGGMMLARVGSETVLRHTIAVLFGKLELALGQALALKGQLGRMERHVEELQHE